MPDSDALNRLRRRLQSALAPTAVLRSNPWVDPKPMRMALKAVEQAFDCAGETPPTQSMKTAVLAFLQAAQPLSFRELKYTCFGVTLPFDGVRDRLVDRREAFKRLLVEVDGQRGECRRFRRCYQALLQSYFAYQHQEGQAPSEAPEPSFLSLRGYLTDRLEVVASPASGRMPAWVLTLKEHDNLLTDRPCDRYTSQLAQGKPDLLAEVCSGLGIGRQSWVWQEVILAYLREICSRNDDRFNKAMDNAMDLAEGKTALTPSLATARTVVSQVVKRYSESTDHPERPRLRDACIDRIGNPWIRRPAWDAWVKHEPARQMVDGWLKSKLMEDFFTLLSDQGGGAVDRRRLTYWLQYLGVIEDMWFVLGSRAYRLGAEEFVEMRRRMAGRMLELTGTDPQNNAFIMRIGGYLIVEYGMKGNACYIYPASQVPFQETSKSVSIHLLKRGNQKLRHGARWEAEFTVVLQGLLGVQVVATASAAAPALKTATERPSAAPIPVPSPSASSVRNTAWPSYTPPTRANDAATPQLIQKLLWKCDVFGVKHEDLRQQGGSLWVYASPTQYPELTKHLEQLGFQFTARRGYWMDKGE